MRRVRVQRERPTAVALAVALCVTMLVVYVLTLGVKGPDVVESMAAAPRVTREIEFAALEGWCVQMGHADSPEAARLMASAWVSQGSAGYVTELEGAWTVLGALYDSEREARRIADRLAEQAGVEADVLELSAEALRLRITAPESQIEAIAAADGMLGEQAGRLGTVALQLDRNEITPDAARTLCALAESEARRTKTVLEAIPGAAENRLCAGLIEALSALADRLAAVATPSATGPALSGMLRCAQLDTFVGQWRARKELVN